MNANILIQYHMLRRRVHTYFLDFPLYIGRSCSLIHFYMIPSLFLQTTIMFKPNEIVTFVNKMF